MPRKLSKITRLRNALKAVLEDMKKVADSGDNGSYNVEDVPVYQAGQQVLLETKPKEKSSPRIGK